MTSPIQEIKFYADAIELIIPTCLEKSSQCLSRNPVGDISKLYKITFKNINDEQLYVKNEYDLRDILKEYCIYKKLCEKIDQEMKSVELDFEIVDHSIRIKNKKDSVVKFDSLSNTSITKRGGKYCEPACGQGPSTLKADQTEPPPPPTPVDQEDDSSCKCCVIS